MSSDPKPKRQLFNRPTWSKPLADADAEESEVFSRTSQSLADVIHEREQKRLRKLERQARAQIVAQRVQEREERDASSRDTAQESIKRRRITDDDYKRFGVSKSPVKTSGSVASSPSKQTISRNAITIDDDEEPETVKEDVKVASIVSPQIVADEEDDDDKMFPELAAAARQRRLDHERDKSAQEDGGSAHLETSTYSSIQATKPEFNPILQILITSPIPNTSPLIVKLKLAQRLQEVRAFWCKRQEFDIAMTDTVFLTYKMRKLHDVTTCKSLGLKFDVDGELMGGADVDAENDQGPDKVNLVAVDEKWFEYLKTERRKKRTPDVSFDGTGVDGYGATQVDEAEEEAKIHIKLKAKGEEERQLHVKSSSRVSDVVERYRKRWFPNVRGTIILVFDGEDLEADSTLQDADIDDFDCIDVHFR